MSFGDLNGDAMLSACAMINRIRGKRIGCDMIVSTVMDFVCAILMMQMMEKKQQIRKFHMVLP